jgi:hypothetical protein
MEEMMTGIEDFYKDKINYETDLKKIYQENLDIIIKQTNTIVSATKVIIDKSEKQQNYETELVEYRKKVAEYEEKAKQG